ncbi:hypothetical protein Btru_062360 [Bulinus truncatus]|nr:hypothetical protein Btru_062360 [Bulinus truncatus]
MLVDEQEHGLNCVGDSQTRDAGLNDSRKQNGEDVQEMLMYALLNASHRSYKTCSVCGRPRDAHFRILMNQTWNTDPSKVTNVENYFDIWALRLASLNQILDPWVYIISRVTCCKGRKGSDHEADQRDSKKRKRSPMQQLLINSKQKENSTSSPNHSPTQQQPDDLSAPRIV